MLEQVLLDFAAEAAAAIGVLAVTGVHQQRHGALQLLHPVPRLPVAEGHVGFNNLLCLGLQHKVVGVIATVADVCGVWSACRI